MRVRKGFYFVEAGIYLEDINAIDKFPEGSTLRIHISNTMLSFPYVKEYLFNYRSLYVPFMYTNKPVYIEKRLDEYC